MSELTRLSSGWVENMTTKESSREGWLFKIGPRRVGIMEDGVGVVVAGCRHRVESVCLLLLGDPRR
jgi:hypothetical protein